VVLQLEGEGVEIHMINQCHDAWEGGPPRNAVTTTFLRDFGEVAALRRSCSDKRTRLVGGGGVARGLTEGKVAQGGNFDTAMTDNF
jgi:hypothetical protein